MGNPVASVEIQAKSTGLVAQLREARSRFGQFADGVATRFGGAMGRLVTGKKGGLLGKDSFLGGAARSAAGNLAAGATSRAADFATDMAQSVHSLNERLARLRIAARQTPEVMSEWSKEMRSAADATGISKDQILGAAEAYVRLTGNVDEARSQTLMFAKTAQATGSSAAEIAETAAALGQNMKVPAEQFEEMFSAMTVQGKEGAIELRDLAKELSTIAPQWAQFGKGTGAQGVRELGAALQIVKKGFGGDAGETVVGLQNFLTAVQRKSAQFKDGGAGSFFGEKGELKSVFQIVDQISKSKLVNNKTDLIKAFGSTEAYRAFIQLRENRAEMDKLVKASEDAGVIQRDFNEYMADTAGRTAKAWENVKNKIADAFTPERIEKFTGALEAVADKMGMIAKGFSLVGDFMGGVFKAGQDIRGAVGDATKSIAIPTDASGLDRLRDEKTFRTSYASILAADSDRGRRFLGLNANTNSAQEAIIMSQATGKGAVAKRAAADRYIAEHRDRVWAEMLGMLKKIAGNTEAGTEVKVDGDNIAKAAKDAPANRTKVAK